MTLRLVDSGWSAELTDAVRADATALRIICPFIKTGALERLLTHNPRNVQVMTRFNLADFSDGVSDIVALRRLLDVGGRVRGIKNLHAKIYIFGTSRVIVTSCNLTHAALDRNHEFGMVSQDPASIATCRAYFDALWNRGGADLAREQLEAWEEIVTRHRASTRPTLVGPRLGDFGADAGISTPPPVDLPIIVTDARQAFVKFLGEGHNRVPLSFPTTEEIDRAGCHEVLAYPASKRPTGVKDDALMFIARLTEEPPNDIRVFGRAIALRHEPERDDATAEDIARRGWRGKWSRYIRVHHPEFVAGTMANGISLNELMRALGPNSFMATQRNAERGRGNTEPRRAYLQQAAVQLSDEGCTWLSERLQAAFDEHGKVPHHTLDELD